MNGQPKNKKIPKMLKGEGITGIPDGGIMGSRKVLKADNDIYDGIIKEKENKHVVKIDTDDKDLLGKRNNKTLQV